MKDVEARVFGPERGKHASYAGRVRNLTRFMRAPLAFLQERQEALGDLGPVELPFGGWLLVSHPADIEAVLIQHAGDVLRDEFSHVLERALGKGLLTSDGELWKRQRRLSSAAFTPKRIRSYAGGMAEVTATGIARLGAGGPVDLHREMSRLTMEVVAAVLFGANVGAAQVETVRHSLEVFNSYFAQSPEAILRLPAWVPTPLNRAVNGATRAIDTLIYGIIEDRRRAAPRDDLLGALLAAKDEDGSQMSDEQLRDETVTLFLAGHETTALSLTYALYLIARHPATEARILAEVAEVVGDRAPTEEDVARLGTTDRVVKEAMRLYPPAWVTGREVAKAFELGGRPIPVGTQIVMSQWLVHRDPRWFPNPEVFDPDRFLPEVARERPRFAYFPFGGGPRVCIGNHFAMMEATLMLAMIVRAFRVELAPFEELRFEPSVTLRPTSRGVRATLVPRAP
jgi:cytochrome P450